MRIFKFAPAGPMEIVLLPEKHQIVHVGLQDSYLYLWAAVDPDAPRTVRYRVWLQATGSQTNEIDLRYHVRTEVTKAGYVWHLFARRLDATEPTGT